MTGQATLTVEEAAQFLRISKYTLYELVKRNEIPSQRVGRQIRFDPDVLVQYLRGKNQLPPDPMPVTSNDLRFVGSHDPVVELLFQFAARLAPPVQVTPLFAGSLEGLIALFRQEATISGVHLWDEKSEEFNIPFVEHVLAGENVTITNLVQRSQGWIVPKGNPFNLKTWDDIGKPGLRFINRQRGSGTRLRLDSFLHKAQIPPNQIIGFGDEENNHFGVAIRVASGQADVGLGVQEAAHRLGLDFVPLFMERYDLVCRQETVKTREWQQLQLVLQSAAFRNAVGQWSGYDTSLTGQTMEYNKKIKDAMEPDCHGH